MDYPLQLHGKILRCVYLSIGDIFIITVFLCVGTFHCMSDTYDVFLFRITCDGLEMSVSPKFFVMVVVRCSSCFKCVSWWYIVHVYCGKVSNRNIYYSSFVLGGANRIY